MADNEGAEKRLTLARVEIALGGGRLLDVALVFDQNDEPVDLVFATRLGGDSLLSALGSGVTVPATVLPSLRDHLAAICEQHKRGITLGADRAPALPPGHVRTRDVLEAAALR
jgi:hypothetical protein